MFRRLFGVGPSSSIRLLLLLFAEYGAQTLDIARHDGKGDVTLETVNLPSASEKTLIFSAKTPLFTKKLRGPVPGQVRF